MKTIKTMTLISVLVVGMTSISFASWWNPFTWFTKKVVPIQQEQKISTIEKNESISNNTEVKQKPTSVIATSTVSKGYEYYVADNKVSLIVNNSKKQTITVDAKEAALFSGPLFLTDMDINFDGNQDLGVYVAMGSGGSSIFYEFYIYDVNTKQLKKASELNGGDVGISNPAVNVKQRQVLSTMRSGTRWVTSVYQYNGTGYDLILPSVVE